MFGDLGGIGSDVIFPWVGGDECTFTSYFEAAGQEGFDMFGPMVINQFVRSASKNQETPKRRW